MSILSGDSKKPFSSTAYLGHEGTSNDACRLTRDRSYSDAHCLFERKSGDTAIKLAPEDHDANVKDGTARGTQTHHIGQNRPRSKSESEYRPTLHKKKHMVLGKQSSGTHSPHHGPTPCSPKNLAPATSCGKMWIRPISIRKQTGRLSPPHGKHNETTCHMSPNRPVQPHFRPVSLSPPDEAEMDICIPMLYSLPASSFEAHPKQKSVVAFGESGKPIKPIDMFRHESPTDTSSGVQAFQWQYD